VPRNIAPDTKIGTEVVRSAYSAIIGALQKMYVKEQRLREGIYTM